MSTSSKKPKAQQTTRDSDLSWKWQIAQRLAKQGRGQVRRNPAAGYMLDRYAPSLNTRQEITASLALTALTDALKEQNDLHRRRSREARERYDNQRSLIEALVQFIVVLFLLMAVGSYAAVDWAIKALDGKLDALSQIPGLSWLLPEFAEGSATTGLLPDSIAFAPLEIATPYLYDDSPPGAWDFTLIAPATDSTTVAIPSPCPGVVDEEGFHKQAGNYVWLSCHDGTRWFMAHLAEVQVAADDTVKLGQSLGLQGSTGNSTGDHVHAVIDPPGSEARWNRKLTKPILDEAFALWQQGNQPVTLQSTSVPTPAIDLVKQLEGLHLEAYPDGTTADGRARWSIGYGTPSKPGETISETEADKRLRAYLAVAAQQVSDLVTVDLTAEQQAALISFEYNTGGLTDSTLLAHVNSGQWQAAAKEFESWIYWVPHGTTEPQVAPGLVTRRRHEQQLFLRAVTAQTT